MTEEDREKLLDELALTYAEAAARKIIEELEEPPDTEPPASERPK